MSKWGGVEFEKEVDKAYDILWGMHERGDWDMKKDQKLINMINCIDNELGR